MRGLEWKECEQGDWLMILSIENIVSSYDMRGLNLDMVEYADLYGF